MEIPTPIADMVTEMLKNCIPMEAIIMSIRSFERAMSTRHAVDETAERRRAWDREYRRKLRGKSADPPDIHPTPPDVGVHALPSLEKKDSYSEEVSNKKERKKEARGCKIPPDWKPNEKHYEYGSLVGMSPQDVDDCAARMRHWCAANANRPITTKSNWDSAFTGAWLLKERGNGKNNGHHEKLGYSGLAAQIRQRNAERENGGPPTAEPDADDFLPFR